MASVLNQNPKLEVQNIGGKGASLTELQTLGFPVPDFLILPTDFSDLSNLNIIIEEHFPGYEGLFAVRSSAPAEDGEKNSFAGQFLTRLNVRKSDLRVAVTEVRNSVKAPQVKTYCKQFNLSEPQGIAVVIQKMIEPEVSGVAFGIHPLGKQPDIKLIEAVWGLGEGLVSGELNADSFQLDAQGKVTASIAEKEHYFRTDLSSKKGYQKTELAAQKKSSACLNKEQTEEIGHIADQLATHFGTPQDIEFCYADGTFYLLQSRPVTVIGNTVKRTEQDNEIIWDNSNIVESYPGISSPLTFSFVRKMYAAVYRQFTALMGVSQREIEANASIFDNMLGFLKGRIYYNLCNWYNALALLPGYQLNAPLMEKMMGVKERFDLPVTAKIKDNPYLRLGRTVFSLLKNMLVLPRMRRRFISDFEEVMQKFTRLDFDKKSTRELLDLYAEFEQTLLKKWKAPIVNDFFAMIAFGLLQKYAVKYKISEDSDLRNDLLIGSQDIISTEPIERCLALSSRIAGIPEEKKRFLSESSDSISYSFRKGELHSDIQQAAEEYLEKWGDRCAGELKLETRTYREHPSRFFQILKSYVANGVSKKSQGNERKAAEEIVAEKLKGKPLRRLFFLFLLHRTRTLVSARENLRFLRTQGFAMVRRIFNALGKNWQKQDFLNAAEDIFYLDLEEIQAFAGGTATTSDLRSLVSLRKKQEEEFASFTLPERIRTKGPVYTDLQNIGKKQEETQEDIPNAELSGTGCCPGEVTAKVRVIHDPSETENLNGDILVTVSTDPGWVLLFPTASAVIVEKGSLLSHSAIVCREMGIPCIVGVKNATKLLRSGELIRMNGRTGTIDKI